MLSQNNENKFLTFRLLDDIMNADIKLQDEIISLKKLYRIGPIVEYIYQTSLDKLKLLNNNQSSINNSLGNILNTNNFEKHSINTSFTSKDVEFHRCYKTDDEYNDARWTAFSKRMEDAAKNSGLKERFAKALVGTFEEMTANLLEHSEKPETGLVGYRWDDSEFEYVVADSGIGVLNSLRKNTKYGYLGDDGAALQMALKYGVSGCENESGRGTGFKTLLHNLANRRSYLRFRSGDHYHTIDGIESQTVTETRESTKFEGFLVSVVCKSN